MNQYQRLRASKWNTIERVDSVNMGFRSKTSKPPSTSLYANGDAGPVADGLDRDTDGLPVPRCFGRQGLDSRQNGPHIVQHTRFEEDRDQRR